MNLNLLLEIVLSGDSNHWPERNKAAFDALFGSPTGRYPKAAADRVTLRAPGIDAETGVPFAAYIHPSNPKSGPYSGMSFVIFPVKDRPCLIGMVAGTHGLSPDEAILGRQGHARKVQAICSWLNQRASGRQIAWAKQDPTRTDVGIPESLRRDFPDYQHIFDRYGNVLYGFCCPCGNRAATEDALMAFLDLNFEERGYQPIASCEASFQRVRDGWLDQLMPGVEASYVLQLLQTRKYVILQGPPGTGKTRMASALLEGAYSGRGRAIQFHPNTTYESFIGGLVPDVAHQGLAFRPAAGFLMQAAAAALEDPSRPYLLLIDEINRADMAKILGEAIFLMEPSAKGDRRIDLPYDFGPPFGRTFFLPENLHILGTMNNADRSIAIVDVAVRRRFSFVQMWPRMSVVERHGCDLMREAFRKAVSIFMEHAPEDVFALVPGHSYFLEDNPERARLSLRVNVEPLLEEYLAQGYVSGFAEPIRGYLQWLRAQ